MAATHPVYDDHHDLSKEYNEKKPLLSSVPELHNKNKYTDGE